MPKTAKLGTQENANAIENNVNANNAHITHLFIYYICDCVRVCIHIAMPFSLCECVCLRAVKLEFDLIVY